ncbi:YfhO family protein [candidate division KSB1 bacterium]|nr:YfhO family protein [candidate division KSB1 bacterium]
MAKKEYKKKQTKKVTRAPRRALSPATQFLIAAGLIFLLVLIYFAPIVFEKKVPPSTDIIAWKGNAQSILQAKKELHYTPLWANNVFSGMPTHLITLRPPFDQPVRLLIDNLTKILQWQPIYFLLGACGMLLLLRFWRLHIGAAMFAALAFIWWPDLIGKIEAGHNSKVQTIMCIPIVLFLFLRLLRKANLLNFSLFAIAFGLAVRAGHYQIVFYLGLALAFFGIVRIVEMIRDKQVSSAALATAVVVIGLVLGIAMSAFNSLQVREYSKYSIRGGTGEEGSTGLDFDYATQWSLHPGEMYNFIIPRFWGGHSSQLYTGDAVPQLKGRTIPGYWGHMPFTSTTDYLGAVAVFFAFFGMILGWRHSEVKVLVALLIFSTLMAFGQHFPALYKLFFNLVPFFNKFRVPVMIVVLVMFCVAALAGFGIDELSQRLKQKKARQILAVIFGIFVLLGAGPLLLRHALPLARPNEIQSYSADVLAMLKTVRFDLLKGDAIRMLALVAAAFGLSFAHLQGWLKKPTFIAMAIVLLLIDVLPIDRRYLRDLIPRAQMDSYFNETPIDKLLQDDAEPHRIYPLGDLSGQAHWSYFHQSIEGYHPAKLRIYQDILESCLRNGTDPGFNNATEVPINWNIVNMLNARYLLAQGNMTHANLQPVTVDQSQKIIVYKNSAALPRAFCVGQTEVIPERPARLARLNQASFRPDSVAIVEAALPASIAAPANWSAVISRYEPNYIDVNISTDEQTLLVLSEIYYPAGWQAFIDDREVEIYKVNHILRGVLVPAGSNTVHFKLEPATYKISVAMMAGSITIVYAALLIGLLPIIRKFGKRS